jgi:hypothetical protein
VFERAKARGLPVLSCRPVEAEAKLAFASLVDLLAAAARGTIRFRPSAGPDGSRRMIAETALDGIAVRRRVVGRFAAAGPSAPKAPARLAATHRAEGLPSVGTGSGRYALRPRRAGADGSARVVQVAASRRRVTIAGVSGTIAGSVSLRALGGAPPRRPGARARFAAAAKPVDRFLPLSRLGTGS